MKLPWILAVATAALVLAGCSSGGATDDEIDPVPDKYTQTWATSYAETTCEDWNTRMTSGQQFAAAADILTAARNKIDGGTGLPGDPLISEFQGGVTTVCVVPTMTLTDAGYSLYTTEPRFHP